MITIARCKGENIVSVMNFISENYSNGHVLSVSRELMDWQYKDGDYYNFLLAWDNDQLMGILGYIPTERYDCDLKTRSIIFPALWCVSRGCKIPLLGLRLMKALEDLGRRVEIAANSITEGVVPLYKSMGYQTGKLEQYYTTNKDKAQKLMLHPKDCVLPVPKSGAAKFTKLQAQDLEVLLIVSGEETVHKSSKYYIDRFIEHPFYTYQVYAVSREDVVIAILVTRIASHEGSSVLRVVDFHGDVNIIADCGTAFLALMQDTDCEYIDFWQYGIQSEIMESAGFDLVGRDERIICPNFFEPFKPENGQILFATKGELASSIAIFRADGDQDRPSRVLTDV